MDKTKQRTLEYKKNDGYEGWDDKEDFERFVVFSESEFYKQLLEEEL